MRLFIFVAVTCLACVPVLNGDGPNDEIRSLQGTWSVTAFNNDGHEMTAKWVASFQQSFIFKGREFSIRQGPIKDVGFITVYPYATPKAIDFVQCLPDGTTDRMRGIYELDGDTLRIAIQINDTGRPGSFFDQEGFVQRFTCIRRKS